MDPFLAHRRHSVTTMLEITGVAKSFGGVHALTKVDLSLRHGEILGLIGANGSGKTTLVNIVSGFLKADGGMVALSGAKLTGLAPHVIARSGLTRTFQNLRIFRRRTALENVLLGQTRRVRRLDLFLPFPTDAYRTDRRRAMSLLAQFGLRGREHDLAGNLSFGDQKRLELARALASEPIVLLLDEPAGGMNPNEIQELAGTLREFSAGGLSILLIEHNMALVLGISDRVAVLASGEMIAIGSPAEIRRDPRVISSYLGDE